jgi:hypothetical protein
MKIQNRLVALVALGMFAAACGGPAEPKSPDERIAEDEKKLEDMEAEGGGQGTELEARDVEADAAAAEAEKSEEAPADEAPSDD